MARLLFTPSLLTAATRDSGDVERSSRWNRFVDVIFKAARLCWDAFSYFTFLVFSFLLKRVPMKLYTNITAYIIQNSSSMTLWKIIHVSSFGDDNLKYFWFWFIDQQIIKCYLLLQTKHSKRSFQRKGDHSKVFLSSPPNSGLFTKQQRIRLILSRLFGPPLRN